MDAIAGWGARLDTEVVHTAELVISELVTNAIQHVGIGKISLTVHLIETVLRIEVCDASPVLPLPDLPDERSENGRGLFIVASLADRYGAEPTPMGKRCWAEIALTTNQHQEITVSLPLQRS